MSNKNRGLEVKKKTCPVTKCLNIIGGKWKPLIIFYIGNNINRFGMIHSKIESVSKHLLTKNLRELESDGVIKRKVFAEVPPRVEYSLTKKGKSLLPIINNMRKWGESN